MNQNKDANTSNHKNRNKSDSKSRYKTCSKAKAKLLCDALTDVIEESDGLENDDEMSDTFQDVNENESQEE